MYGKTPRKSFARYEEILEMPNLLEVQKTSYQWFLDVGLREVFKDVGSIVDYGGNLELSFVDFSMDEQPKYDVEECKARDATYAAPIKVKVQLRNTQNNQINEQEIFMGDFPIMTNSGTFVINGAERVIVSQIVRSPGMYYTREVDKADNKTYATTVIPGRGAWLEYETDLSDVFYVRIDKNRKLPVTCLIRALGPRTDPEILEMFGEDERVLATLEKDACKTYEEALLEIYRKVCHEGYYVKMAVAWAVSVCYVKFPERTEEWLLDGCPLGDWTYNKALQKIVESLRVTPETKARIKTMKRRAK